MKYRPLMRHIILTSLCCCIFLVSCHKQSKSETETTVGNFKTPETIPLQFSEPEPFEWENIPNDSLKTPVTYDLNVNTLPSKPFELNTFKPLKSPMKEYDLDWSRLPSEQLTYDSVPFTVKTSALKKPTITKMKAPGIFDGSNVNLMQLSANEGLKNNDISSLIETEAGSIWISGPQSISHYDGESTFNYEYVNVYDMTFDNEGRLWLATFQNGVYVLDFQNNIEYSIEVSTDPLALVDILYDPSGLMYLASFRDRIYTIDTAFESFLKLTNEGSKLPITLFIDSQNHIWLGNYENISMIDEERQTLKTIPNEPHFNLGFFTDVKEDSSGSIWFTNPVGKTVLNLSLQNKNVKTLTNDNGYTLDGTRLEEDTKGNIWIAGNNEIYILSKDQLKSKSIATNSSMFTNVRGSILQKKDGSLWIGTVDKGVVIVNEHTLSTEYFDTTRGLLSDQVWEIEEDSRGDIWLGTDKGINIIDRKKNTIKSLTQKHLRFLGSRSINFIKEISKDTYFLDSGAGFSIYDRQHHKITQYASDANESLENLGFAVLDDHTFCIYTPVGFFVYDIQNNSFKKLNTKSDPNVLKTRFAVGMVYDGNDILWIPTQDKGLAKVNINTHTIAYLTTKEGLCDNNVGVISFSEEGELWLTTLNGMAILNLEQNTLTNLKEENGLIPTEMYDLIERGNTMYGASVNGLIPINRLTLKDANKGFFNFNEGLGFKYNDYLSGSSKFLENGQFWAGVVNLTNEFRLLIMKSEPKIDSTFSSVHINNMFVMDENPGFGLNIKKDSTQAQASTYANSNNIKWDSVKPPYNTPKGLTLPFDQNSLSFSYGSGDIFNRDKLNYRFILDGEDEDWSYAATATKTKNYYNLKPGNYTFKVAVRSANSDWSVPDTLSFKINPPWWQTWWAYIVFAIIAGSILRAYIVFRARKLTKENRILEERVSHRTIQLKTKIDELKSTQSKLIQSEKMASLGELTAGIAHEIQNPLNFVNNFSEVNKELLEEIAEEIDNGNYDEVKTLAKDVADNESKIILHGKRADGIVKGMLQHSRSSTGQKEPTDINSLSDEYLRLAYHGLRAKDKSFNATLDTNFDDSIGKINIVPQDMGRVILNLITNAFYVVKKKKEQHPNGYEPTVSVRTKKQGDMAMISVLDNGNGVPKDVLDKIFQPFFTTKPSGEGTGLGLSLSYDIVRVHGGELTVDTEQGVGTTFTIALPMN